mmetsp:Transcript_72367/g.235070  ORF Transcript_72367/g.235070 Transcript_72367/m.235070 type:complete len:362 (-) Transcript_72367:159-1244(-)
MSSTALLAMFGASVCDVKQTQMKLSFRMCGRQRKPAEGQANSNSTRDDHQHVANIERRGTRRPREKGNGKDFVEGETRISILRHWFILVSVLRFLKNPVPPLMNFSECPVPLLEVVLFGSCSAVNSGQSLCVGDCAEFTPAEEIFPPKSHRALGDSGMPMLRTCCSNRMEALGIDSKRSTCPMLLPEGHVASCRLDDVPTFNSGQPLARASSAERWVRGHCASWSIIFHIADPALPPPLCSCCKPMTAPASQPVLTLSPHGANLHSRCCNVTEPLELSPDVSNGLIPLPGVSSALAHVPDFNSGEPPHVFALCTRERCMSSSQICQKSDAALVRAALWNSVLTLSVCRASDCRRCCKSEGR